MEVDAVVWRVTFSWLIWLLCCWMVMLFCWSVVFSCWMTNSCRWTVAFTWLRKFLCSWITFEFCWMVQTGGGSGDQYCVAVCLVSTKYYVHNWKVLSELLVQVDCSTEFSRPSPPVSFLDFGALHRMITLSINHQLFRHKIIWIQSNEFLPQFSCESVAGDWRPWIMICCWRMWDVFVQNWTKLRMNERILHMSLAYCFGWNMWAEGGESKDEKGEKYCTVPEDVNWRSRMKLCHILSVKHSVKCLEMQQYLSFFNSSLLLLNSERRNMNCLYLWKMLFLYCPKMLCPGILSCLTVVRSCSRYVITSGNHLQSFITASTKLTLNLFCTAQSGVHIHLRLFSYLQIYQSVWSTYLEWTLHCTLFSITLLWHEILQGMMHLREVREWVQSQK